ncbi:type IV-A pilus assembly ATPase PilB [Cocleimonas flava]|uniref:Type IV pilus assembly protein PilB n=1 Tax=Cocleimonas flava TaxID=634765 RepID=A0A4V2P9B2_9GAMM|nr:type IV-A pilus assembly ATPase PilB [Cocleimonas flava]TCJ88925.1 type IV pilus assembly protein PilB [Cocleimonas flava]
MTTVQNKNLPSLLKKLVADKKLAQDVAEKAVADSTERGVSITTHLAQRKLVDENDLAVYNSKEFGLSLVDIDTIEIAMDVENLLPKEMMRKTQLYPLFRMGKAITIAVADPFFLSHLSDVRFATELMPEPVIVEYSKLQKLLNPDYSDSAVSSGMTISSDTAAQDLVIETNELESEEEEDDSGVDVTEFLNELLSHAIKKKVSDIHIEPYEKILRVRFRLDGMLQVVSMPPKALARKMTSRIKVMAQLNTSERRIPQDGRIHFRMGEDKYIDFRVNTLPTLYGEKIVMRILDSDTAALGIDVLGFDDKQKADLLEALGKPDGMILVTGPTGSGKTVTLYAGLNILNTSERNISTAEDPAEIQVPGINQVNVNNKVGLTFASALRAFLRQDPDIIMVGEIRDLETAEISVKAAQTGHLLLSTLHTNSAPETLTRLINMGVPAFNIASSVHLIVAQRLARRLCKECKVLVEDVPKQALIQLGFDEQEIESIEIYEPNGCGECANGYKGRVGIYQVMPISTKMETMIMDGANSLELAAQAKLEGINDLRQSALNKVKEGVTSLAELERVTKD